MGYLDLTGKRAIVTGAAGGLCLGMAEGLMEAGASVCIIDINPAPLTILIPGLKRRLKR